MAKITQAVIDELKHQAEKQAKTRYRAIEVQCSTMLALLAEIERGRIVSLRFEKSSAESPTQ